MSQLPMTCLTVLFSMLWASLPLGGDPATPSDPAATAAWSALLEIFDDSRSPRMTRESANPEGASQLRKEQADWHRRRTDALAEFVERFPKSRESARARIEWAREIRPTDEPLTRKLLTDVIEQRVDPTALTEARYLLGMVYFRNDATKAAALLKEAAESDGDPEWRANSIASLGDLASKQGRRDEARECFRRVVREFKGTRAALRCQRELKRLGSEEPSALVVGQPLPAVETTTLTGQTISTEAWRGRVVLVDFFTTDDAAWVAELPALQAVFAQAHTSGFEILSVSLDPDRSITVAFRDANGIVWPIHWDDPKSDSSVGRALNVTRAPASFLVDRKGRIRFRNLRGKARVSAIEALLSESP